MKFLKKIYKKIFGIKCGYASCAYFNEANRKCTCKNILEVDASATCRHYCDKTK